jgi:integrase/recombinase XerC
VSNLAPIRDLIAEHLADRRSISTRRAYAGDLRDFFRVTEGCEPSPVVMQKFLALDGPAAIGVVLQYKANLIARGLSENTVNRRLAAIKSLVKFARLQGAVFWDLDQIRSERLVQYRDTTGIVPEEYAKILANCGDSPIGKRDRAILRLIWDNALRRGEISKINFEHYDRAGMRLGILGKGKGTQVEWVAITEKTVLAIDAWLLVHPGSQSPIDPLFVACSPRHRGHRLSGSQIYNIVRGHGAKAGIEKIFSPHRGRHSSITAAAEMTGGDIRKIQQHGRHKRPETSMRYVDNLQKLQGEVATSISDLA